MCDHHPTDISRRGFAGLAALGVGLSLLPQQAAAQIIAPIPNAFCLMCIDYRFVGAGTKFFNENEGLKNYDLVSLAGAALAASSPSKFEFVTRALWEQLGAARYLHPGISRAVVLDHVDCGAYKYQYGKDITREQEIVWHHRVAEIVGPLFQRQGLETEIWLLNDQSEKPDQIWPPKH